MGQLPIFVDEVPDCTVKAGHVHIFWRGMEFVLPISIMLAGMAVAREEIAKWQVNALANEVARLPRRER